MTKHLHIRQSVNWNVLGFLVLAFVPMPAAYVFGRLHTLPAAWIGYVDTTTVFAMSFDLVMNLALALITSRLVTSLGYALIGDARETELLENVRGVLHGLAIALGVFCGGLVFGFRFFGLNFGEVSFTLFLVGTLSCLFVFFNERFCLRVWDALTFERDNRGTAFRHLVASAGVLDPSAAGTGCDQVAFEEYRQKLKEIWKGLVLLAILGSCLCFLLGEMRTARKLEDRSRWSKSEEFPDLEFGALFAKSEAGLIVADHKGHLIQNKRSIIFSLRVGGKAVTRTEHVSYIVNPILVPAGVQRIWAQMTD